MIIKADNKLFNCDGWREVSRDDEYVTVEFFEMYTDEDGSKGSCCHVFAIIDDDYYTALYDKYPQFDHKDVRYIKAQACIKAYKLLLQEFEKGFTFLDVDLLINQEQICKECVEEYLKDWEEEE